MPLIILPKPFNAGFLGLSVPVITTPSPLHAIVATPYSVALAAAGGTQPYTWLITSDSGSGLALNPVTGILFGVVTTVGSYSIVVRVTDANGVHASSTLTLNASALFSSPHAEVVEISWLPPPSIVLPLTRYLASPQFFGETLPAATTGVAYSQNISGQAVNGALPFSFSELSSTGPDVISVSAAGVISFTPTSKLLLTDEEGDFLLSASGSYLTVN